MSMWSTLRGWLSRSAVYNPVHPRDGALQELFSGGVGSSSVVAVTMDSAVTVSAVYAAARVLAETVGSVPLVLYSRNGRERMRDTSDPLYRLLHTQPNPEMTSSVFRETLVYNGALGGNALAEIERNGAGSPIALWPLLADRTRRLRTPDGKYWFATRLKDKTERVLSRNDVLHVPVVSATGLWGTSIVGIARDALGSAIAAQDFSGRFFANGLHTGGFFKLPARQDGRPISKESIDRWREGIKQWQQGLTNAHRYMILEEGMEWQHPGVSPEHAQLLETRKFQVRDVARWFRMPPHMIQDLENATFTNIEHQSLEFVKYTMLPWFTKIEQELSARLLEDEERFFGFVLQGLLRGDHAGRATFYTQMLTNGVLSANEVRELEDLNPRAGGDRFMRPANMIEIDEKGTALPMPRDPAPPRTERVSARDLEAFRPLFLAAARRITAKEQAERAKLTPDEQSALLRSLVERDVAPLFAAAGAEWAWSDPLPVGGDGDVAEQRAAAWFERAAALAKEGERCAA